MLANLVHAFVSKHVTATDLVPVATHFAVADTACVEVAHFLHFQYQKFPAAIQKNV